MALLKIQNYSVDFLDKLYAYRSLSFLKITFQRSKYFPNDQDVWKFM